MKDSQLAEIFIAPAAIAAIILLLFVAGEVVRYLWNWYPQPVSCI